ncbi:hypothetical protein ACFOWA_17120 [Pedobacter lithocola]|uniref:Uncharacterized protein n=1 Tax=Pedobacter lithocola TaxID=1908239 RepID=A0ABV8PFD6_9SPHI
MYRYLTIIKIIVMEMNSNQQQNLDSDNHIEWDNDTYGHLNPELLKKKNEPEEAHLEFIENDEASADLETSKKLKNINLASNDIASRNDDQEKGVGGKPL